MREWWGVSISESRRNAFEMAQISVIVTVYNMLEHLGRCVDSVLAQSFTDFELILVDDGSTDGSAALCDRLNTTDPRIRVIHTENHGVSAARKAGVSVAKSAWLMFVDADDTLPADSLKHLSENAFDDIDIVLGNAYCHTTTGIFALSREMSMVVSGTEFADMLFRNTVPDKLCGLIIRRRLIDLGSWLTSKTVTPCEEQVTLLRVALRASKVIIDNSVFVYEYHNENPPDVDNDGKNVMTAEIWENFFGRIHHLFDSVDDLAEGFFLFRLRQVYSNILLRKEKMPAKDGELSRLKTEAKQHKLYGHDKMILKMLRDPIYRRINLRKFAPPEANGKITVGIVLCVKNSQRRILSAIRRALSQSRAEAIEVIVVDNASTDHTAEIVKSVRAVNPRVHLVSMPEPASAEMCRIAGLKRSIAHYVLFADIDFALRNDGIETLLDYDSDSYEDGQTKRAEMIIGHPRHYSRILGVPLASKLPPLGDDSTFLNILRRVELLSGSDNILFSRRAILNLMDRYVESLPDDGIDDFLNPTLRFNLKMALWLDNPVIATEMRQVTSRRDKSMSAKSIKRDYNNFCHDCRHVVFSLKAAGKATEENCAAVAVALNHRFMSTLSLLLASPLFPTEKAKIWLEGALNHDVWKILSPVLPDNIITLFESSDFEAIIVQALNDLHSRRTYFYTRRLF